MEINQDTKFQEKVKDTNNNDVIKTFRPKIWFDVQRTNPKPLSKYVKEKVCEFIKWRNWKKDWKITGEEKKKIVSWEEPCTSEMIKMMKLGKDCDIIIFNCVRDDREKDVYDSLEFAHSLQVSGDIVTENGDEYGSVAPMYERCLQNNFISLHEDKFNQHLESLMSGMT